MREADELSKEAASDPTVGMNKAGRAAGNLEISGHGLLLLPP